MKTPDVWQLNNILLKSFMGKTKFKMELLNWKNKWKEQYTKNLRDIVKEVIRRKFIVLGEYIWRKERFKINDLSFQFSRLEKGEKANLTQAEGNQTINITVENTELGTMKTIGKIDETKNWL